VVRTTGHQLPQIPEQSCRFWRRLRVYGSGGTVARLRGTTQVAPQNDRYDEEFMHVSYRRWPVSQREHKSQAPDHEGVNEDFNQQEKFICSFVITLHRQKIKVFDRVLSPKIPF
jgi:hypothetical protein